MIKKRDMVGEAGRKSINQQLRIHISAWIRHLFNLQISACALLSMQSRAGPRSGRAQQQVLKSVLPSCRARAAGRAQPSPVRKSVRPFVVFGTMEPSCAVEETTERTKAARDETNKPLQAWIRDLSALQGGSSLIVKCGCDQCVRVDASMYQYVPVCTKFN